MISTIKNLAITRYDRIEMYLNSLNEKIKIKKKKDRESIEKTRLIINNRIKHIKRTTYILSFFYAGIYFSFISLFTSDYLFLAEITSIFGLVVSFFGTTIFFIGAYISNRILELYYQDLNLLTSHIISIYLINETTSDSILADENSYNHFIDFFANRGFISPKIK